MPDFVSRIFAACTMTASIFPMTSTTICRFLPFFPSSIPRSSLADTVLTKYSTASVSSRFDHVQFRISVDNGSISSTVCLSGHSGTNACAFFLFSCIYSTISLLVNTGSNHRLSSATGFFTSLLSQWPNPSAIHHQLLHTFLQDIRNLLW